MHAPYKRAASSHEDRQEEYKAVLMFSVLTSVGPLPLPAIAKGPCVAHECIRPGFGCEVPMKSLYAARSSGWKSLAANDTSLKSKPPWALWLLWFQQMAVGFPQTRNRRGTAPGTHGSFSALPQLEGDLPLLIWACL